MSPPITGGELSPAVFSRREMLAAEFGSMTALREASQEDHQRIFAAIMARDADGARDAMRAHLSRVIAEFTQAWR